MLKTFITPKTKTALVLSVLILLVSFVVYYLNPDQELFQAKNTSQPKLTQPKQFLAQQENDLETKEIKTKTETTAELLLLAYTYKKANPEDIKNLKNIVDKISKEVYSKPLPRYSKEDINISQTFNLNEYKGAVIKALQPLKNINEYELDSVALFIKNKDANAKQRLIKYEGYYIQTINNLLKIPVSEDFAPAHIALVNAYLEFVNSIKLIIGSENDIMLAYPGLDLFFRSEADIKSAHIAIDLYFKSKNNTWLNN